MLYVKIDMSHPGKITALQAMINEFAKKHPDNILSINEKMDGSVAWVKLQEGADVSILPPGIILDTAINKQEHMNKVQADVYTIGWWPLEE